MQSYKVEFEEAFNPYKVLGIESGASLEDAKKAFQNLSKTQFPDKLQRNENETEADFLKRKDRATEAWPEIQKAIKIIRGQEENEVSNVILFIDNVVVFKGSKSEFTEFLHKRPLEENQALWEYLQGKADSLYQNTKLQGRHTEFGRIVQQVTGEQFSQAAYKKRMEPFETLISNLNKALPKDWKKYADGKLDFRREDAILKMREELVPPDDPNRAKKLAHIQKERAMLNLNVVIYELHGKLAAKDTDLAAAKVRLNVAIQEVIDKSDEKQKLSKGTFKVFGKSVQLKQSEVTKALNKFTEKNLHEMENVKSAPTITRK